MGVFLPINGIKSRTLRSVSKDRNPGRYGPGSFRLCNFGLNRFGQFFGWVVSAFVGGSFRFDFCGGSFRP